MIKKADQRVTSRLKPGSMGRAIKSAKTQPDRMKDKTQKKGILPTRIMFSSPIRSTRAYLEVKLALQIRGSSKK
jgi:hypothetical protein